MNEPWVLLILAGLFALAGAGFNWDWFMDHRKARFFTKLLGGRQRVRIFYGIFGVGLLILGILGIFGIVQ